MEMLQVADAVAREKNIEREIVLEAMEEAIQKAGRSKYGHDHDIRATINRKTGQIDLKRYREVVAELDPEEGDEMDTQKLTLEQAQREKKDAKIGDFLIDGDGLNSWRLRPIGAPINGQKTRRFGELSADG